VGTSGAIRGVTFDFWNTLVYEDRGHLRGRRLDRWAGILETDIAGGRALGMTTVRFTGINDDDSQPEPEADHVVDDNGRLPIVLGIG
jgi:FMN phosphatase YigB (HAD superfamily)